MQSELADSIPSDKSTVSVPIGDPSTEIPVPEPMPRLLGAIGGALGLAILVLLPAAFFCPGSFWLAMKVSFLSGFLVGFVWPTVGAFGLLVFGILGQGL